MNNSGQPAFPEQDRNMGGDTWTVSGLTKREYAAIKAMQGILAGRRDGDGWNYEDTAVATWAVAQADALLTELDKPQTA